MGRLLQIYEDDLAELERTLPLIADELVAALNNRTRVQFRRVKEILSNVRWNYGPQTCVAVLPVGPQQPPDDDQPSNTTGA